MSTTTGDDDALKQIVFTQFDIPALRTGSYTLTATHTVPNQDPGTFAASATFVVQGERFSFRPEEILSVFPPPLANGEFDGSLPHVVFTRRTLPWERALRFDDESLAAYPWLAVILVEDATAPEAVSATAKELVPVGTAITVVESTVTGTGTLPANILSYGATTLVPMGYGESPDDKCLVIDLPLATFNQVAPSLADLQYLAHIREVDTSQGHDAAATTEQYAVVVGNRIAKVGTPMRAFLVSLENFADYLPQPDGTPSAKIPAGTDHVRLLAYRSWTFTANDLGERLDALLSGLNAPPAQTTLRLPLPGAAPTPARVQQALADAAAGTLTDADGAVLAQNALAMGYVPLGHHLRHGGKTVSWYRGPLVPYPVPTHVTVPIAGPDAANRYDPFTGIFDVSYGMAWQLGQLLALQNRGVANSLYQWRLGVKLADAVAAEHSLIDHLLDGQRILESFFAPRQALLRDAPPPLPDGVPEWLGTLATLQGIPFNYLVPDARMLPPESLRFFFLDFNWIDALVDGAFSIGRSNTAAQRADQRHVQLARSAARGTMGALRAAAAGDTQYVNPTGQVTGCLIRSQAVAGWPNLRFHAFSDEAATKAVPLLRSTPLSSDVVLCLFDGVVETLRIQEPPEQLHMGVEVAREGTLSTTLRELDPPTPGTQFLHDPLAILSVSARADGQTLKLADAATRMQGVLANHFHQTLPQGITSAEFAVEMTKGVVMVEYQNTAQGSA